MPYPYCGALGAHTNLGCALPEVYLMLAECEARAGSESEAKRILKEFRSYRLLDGYEDVPASVKTKEELIRFCVEEQTREFVGTGYREAQLKIAYPKTILNWNEDWKK